MSGFLERAFDLGEGLRAVWRHEDGTRCHGLYPGVPAEGLWWMCGQTQQPVHLVRIRPMIDNPPRGAE